MHVFSRIPFEWYNKLIFAVLDLSPLHWCRNRKFFTLIFAVLLQNFLNLLQNRVVDANVIDLSHSCQKSTNRSLRSTLQCWPFKIHCGPQNWIFGTKWGYMCIKSQKALFWRKFWYTTRRTLLATHFGYFWGADTKILKYYMPYFASNPLWALLG